MGGGAPVLRTGNGHRNLGFRADVGGFRAFSELSWLDVAPAPASSHGLGRSALRSAGCELRQRRRAERGLLFRLLRLCQVLWDACPEALESAEPRISPTCAAYTWPL